jgi:hypothetical protein
MMKEHISRRKQREVARRHEPDAKIFIAGTMVSIPPQLASPMPTDMLRVGVPIMRPGFITTTGPLPLSGVNKDPGLNS